MALGRQRRDLARGRLGIGRGDDLIHQCVGAGAVVVQQVKNVLVDGACALADEGAIGHPGVGVNADADTVGARHSHEAILPVARVRDAEIGPAARHRSGQLHLEIARRERAGNRGVGDDLDGVARAVAEPERVRHVSQVRSVIDQEVGFTVLECAAGLHQLYHFMDADLVDERKLRVTQAVDMLEGSAVAGEQALYC